MEKDLTQLQARRTVLQGGSGEGEDSSSFLVLACEARNIVHVTPHYSVAGRGNCRQGKPQSGARRMLGPDEGASMAVSPSAPQVSICLGHFNC